MNSLRRLVHGLRVFDREAERLTGLSGAQLFVLGRLATGGAATINDLAERTCTHQSSVSVVAQKLVKRGLVSRSHPRQDGRQVQLTLTAAGRRMLARAPAAAQDRLIAAMARLSVSDRLELARLLGGWVDAAGLNTIHPAMFFQEIPKRKSPAHGRKRN
jgi:DNA-binding MarR family transcriptional regulator